MAEVAIELLLKQAAILITDEVNLYRNFKKEIEDLVKNLKKIKMILDDAERKQMREPLVKSWLEDLQDVAYDVEDALDIWEAKHAEAVATVPSNVENVVKKVRLFVQSLSSCCKGVVEHRTVALEIKDLNGRIKKIYSNGSNGLELINRTPTSESQKKPDPNDRITSSFFIESEVFGREEDKKTVKDMLLSFDDAKENKTIPVVSIVGAGGLGKTTLAKMVYKELDSDVFPKKIWVCVSDQFDQIAVAKQILEQLDIPSSNVSGLDKLIQLIQTSLKDSKFLLVLDDVWVEKRGQWDQLNACLSSGVKGSVILVTTRKLNTAQVVFHCGCQCIHELKEVDADVCWSIIKEIAGEIDHQLEAIGKKIAEKCAGSPLAAQVLGGLLRKKTNVKDWRRILDSEIWQLTNVEEELFRHFFLSYDELDPAAKRCFSFCAVFPKDFYINVEKLIRMWMAQGFLSDRDGEMEVEGQRIFDDLSQRSLFQDFRKLDHVFPYDDRVVGCKMHDIVHDFAQFLTKNECVAVANNRSNNKLFLEKTRHLSWLERDKPEITLVSAASKLRTFLCKESLPSNFLKYLKCVRELSLYSCGLKEIPEEIGNLIHLRYLDLSRNDIIVIPQGICNLSKLQTLDLSGGGFHNYIRELPEEMGRLVKLRHFSMDELILFAGLEGLRDLRTLSSAIKIRKGGENKLGCLAELNQLEGHLEIRLEGLDEEADVEEAKKAALIQKKSLRYLHLSCDKKVKIGVVEALQPNPELMCLELRCHALPKWIIIMINLRKLNLHGVPLDELSSLWKLPFLEVLRIVYGGGQNLGREFLGLKKGDDALTSSGSHVINEKQSTDDDIIVAFPSLKTLSFSNYHNWREWEDISEEEEANNPTRNIFMPRLTLLEIRNCLSLKEMPHRLLRRLAASSSLQTLKGFWSPGLKNNYDDNSTERGWGKSSHIPYIQILYEKN